MDDPPPPASNPGRPRHPSPIARLLSVLALLAAVAAEARVVRMQDVLTANPLSPVREASVTEILRGEQASVNVWQVTGDIPAHLHREHEEVIVVRSGRARARIGERSIDLGPGDVLLIPKNTVHEARTVGEEPCVGVSVFAPAFDGQDRVAAPAGEPAAAPAGEPAAAPAGEPAAAPAGEPAADAAGVPDRDGE